MKKIYAHEKGSGDPVLLLHGFPMNAAVWNDLSVHLSGHFRVIAPDLPGFGKSPLPDNTFSIDDIAGSVLALLAEKGIQNVVVIGHSLGGYIALAMAARSPQMLAGFGLLHSTAYPDSEEKKLSRTKTIEFVEKNGAEAFTANFISPLFADPAHPAIGRIRSMNMEASAQVITAYTRAMRDRPDRTGVLKNFQKPVLFISGGKDPGIPVSAMSDQARMASRSTIHVLEDQAHMALVEKAEATAALISDFAWTCYPEKHPK